MDFENEIVISIVLAFSSWVALLPLIFLGKLSVKQSIGFLAIGVLIVPASALWTSMFVSEGVISVLLLDYSGPKRSMLGAYYSFFLSSGLAVVSVLRASISKAIRRE